MTKPTSAELLDDFLATTALRHERIYVERIGRDRVERWVERLLQNVNYNSGATGPSLELMTAIDTYLQSRGLIRRSNAPHNRTMPANTPSRAALERVARDQSGGRDYRPRFALLCVMAGMEADAFTQWFPEFDHRRACAEIETCPQHDRLALREGVEEARRLDGRPGMQTLSADRARELHARWMAGDSLKLLSTEAGVAAKTLTNKWTEMRLTRERGKGARNE